VIVLPCTSCDKTRSLAKWLNLSCQNGCVTKPGHPSLTNKNKWWITLESLIVRPMSNLDLLEITRPGK
jgi:hypothetical protein